jgi:hypothetical protein
MLNHKLVKAFLIPPLIPVFGYFLMIAFSYSVASGMPDMNLGLYLFWLISIAYLITLFIFVPIYLLLLHFGRNNYKHIVLTSAAAFFLLAWGVTNFRLQLLPFAILSAIAGVIYAYVFCKIAGRDNVAGV